MQRFGGAVILMQQSLNNNVNNVELLDQITYLAGGKEIVADINTVSAREPFDEYVVDFLNDLSKCLMRSAAAKAYPDVITLGFWIRKSSVLKLKERFVEENDDIHVGRGVAFHIAPSNVPVNYAYSLVTGLLTGNANIVRIPSKDFPQVQIINEAINKTLENYPDLRSYICLIRYGRNQEINDLLSSLADTRIVWGGDTTIAEIRKSPLGPRASEITFADRFSLSVIDSDVYLQKEDKDKIAEDFYNDTYLTDQNACTSPRIIVWTGTSKAEAKKQFWSYLHDVVEKKYTFQSIMGINKLTSGYLMAVAQKGSKIELHEDNLIVRVQVPAVKNGLMELKDNSGYFFEYDCDDILELRELCDDNHCQTIGFMGRREDIMPLINSGIRGVDRIVPIGKTMDFDFIWDGYNLFERLTRIIKITM